MLLNTLNKLLNLTTFEYTVNVTISHFYYIYIYFTNILFGLHVCTDSVFRREYY